MEELWTWSAGNVKFLLFIHYTIIFPQITVVSALTNLTIPTRTGPPHQPMMSPRTAWRRALQEHGNPIPAVQKSIVIEYNFEGISLTIFTTDSMCARSQTKIMVELLSKLHLKLLDARRTKQQRVWLNVGLDGHTRDPVATFLIPQR